MFISQLNILQIKIVKQLQDDQNGQSIVFMEFIKNMAIHTLNTLTLMRMELDAHQKRGRY